MLTKQAVPFRIRFEPETGQWSLYIPALHIYKLVGTPEDAEKQTELMFEMTKPNRRICQEANNTYEVRWAVFYEHSAPIKKE